MKFIWGAIVLLAAVVLLSPKGTTIIEDGAQNGATGSAPIIPPPPNEPPPPEPEVQPQLDPDPPRRWRRGRRGCPAPSKWSRRVGFGLTESADINAERNIGALMVR